MIHLWRGAVCCLGGAAPVHLHLSLWAIKQCWQCNPLRLWSSNTGRAWWQDRLWLWHVVVGWAGVTVGLTRHYPGVVAAPRWPGSPSGVTLWPRHSQMALSHHHPAKAFSLDFLIFLLSSIPHFQVLRFDHSAARGEECTTTFSHGWMISQKEREHGGACSTSALVFDNFGARGCSHSLHHHGCLGRDKRGA